MNMTKRMIAYKLSHCYQINAMELNKESKHYVFLQVVVKAYNVHPKDPEFPPSGVDDMTRLAYLHEPGVLQNLQIRYDSNEIYVSTGLAICIMHPLKKTTQNSMALKNVKKANISLTKT